MEQIAEQNHNRKRWRENDSPTSLIAQIVEEAQELQQANDQFEVKPNAEYHLIGEVGDILYLTLKLCEEMGIDPEEAINLKLARNSVKYPDHFHNNGWDFNLARKTSKSLWEHLGGDDAFYLWHSLWYPLDDEI